jgi:hypothetical protein
VTVNAIVIIKCVDGVDSIVVRKLCGWKGYASLMCLLWLLVDFLVTKIGQCHDGTTAVALQWQAAMVVPNLTITAQKHFGGVFALLCA